MNETQEGEQGNRPGGPEPSKTLRILLLARRLPFPIDNGEDHRVFNFMQYLTSRHDVEFLGYGDGDANPTAPLFRQLHRLPPPVKPAGRRTVRGLIRSLSPHDMFLFDERLHAKLRSLVAEGRFDVLWVPAWHLLPTACSTDTPPIFFDAMDDGVLENAREVRSATRLDRRIVSLKHLFVNHRFERFFFPRVAACCFVSERDAQACRRWVTREARVVVIPNGVDYDFYKPVAVEKAPLNLVFEGNMTFGPNFDAAIHFAQEIFPLVLREVPESTFCVVGKDPPPALRELASGRVEITGTVDDVRPYLSRAAVFVCPMRKGAGIKNKMLQAWSMEKAVVASPIACEGVMARDGENVLVADTPATFAERVVELLRDPARREALARAGRETVLREYSWNRRGQQLETCFHEIAGAAARSPRSKGAWAP